ncbi:putative glycoside hydrolase [Rothia nasisuis]|uniref:putative glycoside hydrolase n=1 Tax=Rothia nasisuis TaxID=2109647 RepID=UPI001F1D498D|nr:putative glycoside hydrolase [Rothia nasisuis]
MSQGLWVRYGGEPITEAQIEFAARHYTVALLQPQHAWAATRLKALNPAITVLCYKCLSSTRSYETVGPFTSGVSYAEAQQAEQAGEQWFARRLDGQLIEWTGYPGHYQMQVWSPAYRKRWVENVTAELAASPFDGVMADNDTYGDYYGLNLPIQGAHSMSQVHQGLDALIAEAGEALNARDKLLVPNIAESRMDPGKWERHSAYGGGFEEVFLGWSVTDFLDQPSALAQVEQMMGHHSPVALGQPRPAGVRRPRLTLLRAASDGRDAHPNFLAALAAFWVFGAGHWSALSAGDHDAHNGTPWREELGWDLGFPQGDAVQLSGAWVRSFSGGWAAVNLSDHASGALAVPVGLLSAAGVAAPTTLVLPAHSGVLYRFG